MKPGRRVSVEEHAYYSTTLVLLHIKRAKHLRLLYSISLQLVSFSILFESYYSAANGLLFFLLLSVTEALLTSLENVLPKSLSMCVCSSAQRCMFKENFSQIQGIDMYPSFLPAQRYLPVR